LLEMLVDYGVVVFAFILIFYLGLLWNLFRVFRASESHALQAIALATFIALVEFPVASLSSSGLTRNYAVWLLFATALCVINHYRLGERKNEREKKSFSRVVTEPEVYPHA